MASMVIYVDEELKEQVERVAKIEDRSVSYLVRKWIEDGLTQFTLKETKSPSEQLPLLQPIEN